MTVNELITELKDLQTKGYGMLNVAFDDEVEECGMRGVKRVDVLVDNHRIGKFVKLNGDNKDE